MMSRSVVILGIALVFAVQSFGAPASSANYCDTRKTLDGGCCVFPFKYRGKMIDDCTTVNHNKEWCATTDDYDANSNKWGVCDKAPVPIFDQILQTNDLKNETSSRASLRIELFQGDIVLTDDIKKDLSSRGLITPWDSKPPKAGSGRKKRAVMRYDNRRWMRGGRGYVPYHITSSNNHARNVILRSMRHWESKVPCLRFVPYRSGMGKYLSFFSGGGCYSMVGRQPGSGAQRISIGRGCESLGVIAHEIGHALGFWHEQSRPDRDRYVRIKWGNIRRGMAFNFHKYDTNKINSRGISYDYKSIMHYSSTAFSIRRGAYTIIGIDGRTNLGQRYGLSAKDVQQANLLYCGRGPKPPTRPPRPPTRPPRPPTPKPPPLTPPPPGGCRYTDKHRWCPYWKAKGYCQSSSPYSTYMSTNCKKSCNCRNTSCTDKFRVCSKWKNLGYCARYVPYVRVYCKRSCRAC